MMFFVRFALRFSFFSHVIVSFFLYLFNNIFVLSFFKKGLFHKLRQFLFAFLELIRYIFFSKNLPILITYDFAVSPPTYGDFLLVIFLCRFFRLHQRDVYLFVPNCSSISFLDEFKSFSLSLGIDIEFIEDSCRLSSLLDSLSIFRLFDWSPFTSVNPSKHYFNFFNLLLAISSKNLIQSLLIRPFNFPDFKPPFSSYIALHCRYTSISNPLFFTEKKRNTDQVTFLKTVRALSKLYSSKPIVILTSIDGFKYFSSVVREHNLSNVYFADSAGNYFSAVPYVIFSHSYFQLNGGGIGTVAWFSDVPYFICVKAMANEVPLNFFHLSSWSRRDQINRQILINYEFFSFLKFFAPTTH